jgi:hypothetical protein
MSGKFEFAWIASYKNGVASVEGDDLPDRFF